MLFVCDCPLMGFEKASVTVNVTLLLTSCSCSTAGRELTTWTGTHVGSGTEAIATWIPANCWKEEEEGEFNLFIHSFHVFQQCTMKQTETELSPVYLLSSPLGLYCHIKEDLRMEELTDNTLVSSWQSLPAWTAVWMEARATHIGPDRDKKERTNKLRPPKHILLYPKQIHSVTSYFLSYPRPARPLPSE